jgi:hypothetical protein
MINVRITEASAKSLYVEIGKKIQGSQELISVATQNRVMDVAYSKAAVKFLRDTHLLAMSNKKSLHHVYEWGQTGKETGRLYRLIKRRQSGGSAIVYYKFINSKKKSPIHPNLKVPGPTGKVVTKSSVFKKKAAVMESGMATRFVTRKAQPVPVGRGVQFVPRGYKVYNNNPGGAAVVGSFEKQFRSWWMMHFPTILENSGVISKLEKDVAKALSRRGAGKGAAKAAIAKSLSRRKIIGSIV